MKMEDVFIEIMSLEPDLDIAEFMIRRKGRFRFPIYLNENSNNTLIDDLELSARAKNCLEEAGFRTVGDLFERLNKREDLRRLRNCGDKTMDEIMEQLFCYQYSQIKEENKLKYIRRIIDLNIR